MQKETVKRYVLFIIGLFFSGHGDCRAAYGADG